MVNFVTIFLTLFTKLAYVIWKASSTFKIIHLRIKKKQISAGYGTEASCEIGETNNSNMLSAQALVGCF